MKKRTKKSMVITKKEHDAWHRKNKDYDDKIDSEHRACHMKYGIVVKKS